MNSKLKTSKSQMNFHKNNNPLPSRNPPGENLYNDAKRRLKKQTELSMKKETTTTSSYINDSSH